MIARAVSLAIGTLLTAGCSTAGATAPSDNPDLTCTLVHPAKNVNSLRMLPSPVRIYIKYKVGPMADRGAFFNAGDVVIKPGPFDRFIRGGRAGGHWFVWYEHGGFAYWKQIVILDVDAKGRAWSSAETRGSTDLCADTDALLYKAAKVRP